MSLKQKIARLQGAAIEKAAKELTEKLMPIGAKLYESASAGSEADSKEQETEAGKEAPVEGEVVDDKDDKDTKNKKTK